MRKRIRGTGAALLCLLCLFAFAAAGAAEEAPETGLERFPVYHGSRESRKIALTVDDVNEPEWARKTFELCGQYGIQVTFFPNGYNIHEEDAGMWREIAESDCEIGSHCYTHDYFEENPPGPILDGLGLFQQQLDKVLGYHYEVRWYRPPFGHLGTNNDSEKIIIRTIRLFGYDHALLWDVSSSNDADVAIRKVKNGSILLFHAREKDYRCLEKLIPMLLEEGYEPVTVSALFGFDPPERGGEPYVYDPNVFREH